MERFIGTDIASVGLFFNIFTTGIETYSISYRGTTFVSLCRRSLPPGIETTILWDTDLRLSVILKTLTLIEQ